MMTDQNQNQDKDSNKKRKVEEALEELKEIQDPLKRKYKEDGSSATVTLHAKGDLNDDKNVSCNVETGRAVLKAGLHPMTGGTIETVCSGDMLLQALVGCAGVTVRAVATAFKIDLKGGYVLAEADLDVRGTLGVSKDVPVGFKDIRLKFELDAPDADEATLNKLIQVSERYCVVYQTLKNPAQLSTSFTRTTINKHVNDEKK